MFTCKGFFTQGQLLSVGLEGEEDEGRVASIFSVPSKCAEQAEEFVRKVSTFPDDLIVVYCASHVPW